MQGGGFVLVLALLGVGAGFVVWADGAALGAPRAPPDGRRGGNPARRSTGWREPSTSGRGRRPVHSDDRLVLCNNKFREIFVEAPAPVTPGTPYEEMLRVVTRRGLIAHIEAAKRRGSPNGSPSTAIRRPRSSNTSPMAVVCR